MAISPISNSTPPQTHLREVILDDSLPETERLALVKGFLGKNAAEGGGLYATHTNGETTFYLAEDAGDSHERDLDEGSRNRAAEAELARQELRTILHACVKEKIVDRPAPRADGEANEVKQYMRDLFNNANDIKAEKRFLLYNAIDNTTRTTGTTVTDGFVLPEAPNEQGQGQTAGVVSLPTQTWMQCTDRSSTPPAPLDSPPPDILYSPDAYELVRVVAEFASRFERVDKAEERAGLPAPVLPDTKNSEITEKQQKKLKGIAGLFPYLKIGEKTFEPMELLGAGSFGQVLRYRCEEGGETGETKVVKLARHRPMNPAMSPEENKAAHANFLKRQREQAADELSAGQKYAACEHNVLGYTEHATLKNGTVALIGDDVGRDDVLSFTGKMKRLFRARRIGPHELRLIALTLTRDIIQGVAWLKKNGAVHGDMKPGNQVIDANGVAHLIDLGMTQAGPITMYCRIGLNHLYVAPEILFLNEDNLHTNESSKRISKHLNKDVNDIHETLARLVPPEHRDRTFETAEETRRLFKEAAQVLGEGAYGIDSQADVFGTGVTLTVMLTEAYPYYLRMARHDKELMKLDDSGPNPRQEARRAAVFISKAEAAVDPTMKGVSSTDTVGYIDPVGDPWLDPLLSDILTPNPKNRMEAEKVLEHASMSYAAHDGVSAVGSPEVRELIKGIMYGTEDDITKAVEALRNAHRDPELGPGLEHQAGPVHTASSASNDVPSPPLSSDEWSSYVIPLWSSQIPPAPPRSGDPGHFETGSVANGAPPFSRGPHADAIAAAAARKASSDVPSPPPSTGQPLMAPLEPLLESSLTSSTSSTIPSLAELLEARRRRELRIQPELDRATPPPPPLSSDERSPSNATPLRSSQIPPAPPRSGDPGYFETGILGNGAPPFSRRRPPEPGPDKNVRIDSVGGRRADEQLDPDSPTPIASRQRADAIVPDTASSASSDAFSASSDANGAPPFQYRPGAEPGPDGNIRFDR